MERYAAFSLESAESIMERLALVLCFYVEVRSAPSFKDLHTTIRIENLDITPFVKMFDVDVDVLSGHATDMQVKAAINRLITALKSEDIETLEKELQEHIDDE